ncbi:peptide chain release factor N(5)-glutamine methyltransferase [Aliicoccus persicus]|uniref:peptide chain release factor N(5)-glutamine methyltransferase n=1 Tax=Aliicoccus persicus TaxID=930138 RepID=A0A662Z7Q6_9STAP|nr:peptide chain release factor N(5)-glutamine methyltransferase [Aliicoccus persicus]SEW08222.1 release factor glutamine methyltransferase [Aliicoccus persicus]
MQVSKQAAIFQAEKRLKESGLEPRVATLVFQDLFNVYQVAFTLALSEPISERDQAKYDAAIARVLTGEPYQYVVGFAHFYDAKFTVNPNVLIPRFETEELVDFILKRESNENLTIADIGTGTGAIGLTLAQHADNHVYMTDKFEAAIQVAKSNASMLNADKQQNVHFLVGDMFEPLIENNIKVDVLVSNPPYIAAYERDVMSADTLFEPQTALFAPEEGLYFYKQMVEQLERVLNPGGRVYFEIGYKQGDVLKNYIHGLHPNITVEVIKDINQNDRIIHFTWEAM